MTTDTETQTQILPADIPQPVLTPLEYAGRVVLVVGMGESGSAVARWLAFKGATLKLVDSRTSPPSLESTLAKIRQLDQPSGLTTKTEVVLGAFSPELLAGVDVVAWSPGLSTELGATGEFYSQVVAKGLPVIGELDLFAQAISDLGQAHGYFPKIIAVTGTNGKTTTVSLVQHLCSAAGKRAVAAGNISPSLLDALFDAMQTGTLPDVWALELSSFQLALAHTFAPTVATILNFSQNHLDWHSTEASYKLAKLSVFGSTGSAISVINRSEDQLIDASGLVMSFGPDQPTQVGAFGLVRDGGLMWLAQGLSEEGDALPAMPLKVGINKAGNKFRARKPVAVQEVLLKKLMPADALKIRGRHNQMNALAALAMCTAIGIPIAAMLHALRTFEGQAHRCQLVGVINDIEYYNDSKATTIAATVAALSGLDKPSVLIAGGVGKGQDFSALAQPVREHAKLVLLIGQDTPLISQALKDSGVEIVQCQTLEDAVQVAHDRVRPGEVVLLSPACASFDMFSGYDARGHAFVAAVEALQ
jgi:UDP-N-acetylmuramoylalanine--D-glutamate ligase